LQRFVSRRQNHDTEAILSRINHVKGEEYKTSTFQTEAANCAISEAGVWTASNPG